MATETETETEIGALLSKEEGDRYRRSNSDRFHYLKELKGMEKVEGELDYPLLRKKEKVELTDRLKEELIGILKGIKEVITLPEPPRPLYLRVCRKCALIAIKNTSPVEISVILWLAKLLHIAERDTEAEAEHGVFCV